MRSAKGLPLRLLCTETLEGRWLLSAAASPVPASPPPADPPFDDRADDDDDDDAEDGMPEDASTPPVQPAADDADDGEGEDDDPQVVPTPSATFSDTEWLDDVGVSTDPTSPAGGADAIEVIELEPADEDEADGDVDVPPSKLPPAVRAAFAAQYP